MLWEPSPGERNDGFGVEEDSDVASDAERWFELVGGVGGD